MNYRLAHPLQWDAASSRLFCDGADATTSEHPVSRGSYETCLLQEAVKLPGCVQNAVRNNGTAAGLTVDRVLYPEAQHGM
jgi:hypothetical protein